MGTHNKQYKFNNVASKYLREKKLEIYLEKTWTNNTSVIISTPKVIKVYLNISSSGLSKYHIPFFYKNRSVHLSK
jgi:hypothetical protein